MKKMFTYDVKCVAFDIYAAGFVDGINSKNDSATTLRESFNKYIESLERNANNDEN